MGGLLLAATLFTGCLQQPPVANTNTNTAPVHTLTLSKTTFAAGENIDVTFTTDVTEKTAWIGVIPSATPHGSEDVNDGADVSYVYLDGATSGKKTLRAPMTGGSFDLRLNESDKGGKELASVTFTVTPPAPVTGSGSTLMLNKTTYTPGEQLDATFAVPAPLSSSAWIGVIPSATPHGSEATNDGADVSYMYLDQKTSGKVTLYAPMQAGTYDLRLNESDAGGKELTASGLFTVAAQ